MGDFLAIDVNHGFIGAATLRGFGGFGGQV